MSDTITAAEYHRLTKRSKYGNRPQTIDGYHHDSKAEARRWRELEQLQRSGTISQLTHHPRYKITINGQHICVYEADSSYLDHAYAPAKLTVEDVKSVATRTPLYLLKAKLFRAIYGFDITEVMT